jgi:hypothetical protein
MIKLTDEMKERVNTAFHDGKPCILVTASKDGKPSVSFRGSMMAWDDEHLAYWERSHFRGEENLEENPNVVVFYMDYPARVGWRFIGQAAVYKDGDLRQRIMDRTIKEELEKDPEHKGHGVLIRVDKIRAYARDTVVQER